MSTMRERMKPYTVYVSGPMTNIPEFNFPAFDAAAKYLRDVLGWAVLSPAENDRKVLAAQGIHDITKVHGYAEGNVVWYNESVDTHDLFRWDFSVLIEECDAIVLMDGWEKSTGARYERVVAEALGLDVWVMTKNHDTYLLVQDTEQRLTEFLRGFPNQGAAKAASVR